MHLRVSHRRPGTSYGYVWPEERRGICLSGLLTVLFLNIKISSQKFMLTGINISKNSPTQSWFVHGNEICLSENILQLVLE